MAVKVARRAKPIRKQPQLGKVGRKAGPPPQRHPPRIQRGPKRSIRRNRGRSPKLQTDYTMNPATGVPEYTGDFTAGISPTNFQQKQWDMQSINRQRELFDQMPSGTGSIVHTGPSARVHVEAAGGQYTYGNSYVFYRDGSYEEIAKGSQ